MTPALTLALLSAAAIVIVLLIVVLIGSIRVMRRQADTNAELRKLVSDGTELIEKQSADRRTVGRALAEKVAECAALQARLAKFTAPRKRDERGHFVKDVG